MPWRPHEYNSNNKSNQKKTVRMSYPIHTLPTAAIARKDTKNVPWYHLAMRFVWTSTRYNKTRRGFQHTITYKWKHTTKHSKVICIIEANEERETETETEIEKVRLPQLCGYIPHNMHTVLLRFVLLWWYYNSYHVSLKPTKMRLALLCRYIPNNMHMVLLRFVSRWWYYNSYHVSLKPTKMRLPKLCDISHIICTQFCCASFCCGDTIILTMYHWSQRKWSPHSCVEISHTICTKFC